ncbi:MAG: hypothetical protein JWN67_719 [Actinomycetia bacterium]|nr:hypothetical protein [Actinomycetes bacterium]
MSASSWIGSTPCADGIAIAASSHASTVIG